MELTPDGTLSRPEGSPQLLRPAAIWLGLGSFLVGSLFLGVTLAAENTTPFAGPILLLLGVALIGGGFTMETAPSRLDPDIEFEGLRWYFVAGISTLFLCLSAVVLLLAVF